MASLPVPSVIGSYASSGVRDVIDSYRRAQTYFSDSVSASASDEELFDDDLYAEEEAAIDAEPVNYVSQQGIVGNFEWDEEEVMTPRPTSEHGAREYLSAAPRQYVVPSTTAPTPFARAAERTPLLRQSSPSSATRPPCPSVPSDESTPTITQNVAPAVLHRRVSQLSSQSGHATRNVKYTPAGCSTFGQTLFNSIAILLGIGMLSEPLAFAYAGWIGGSLLILFYGFITCYTAKILAHIILSDPRLRSYSDIGRKAFGPRAGPWVSALFCLELFTVSVALVTLYADSLYAVIPYYSIDTYKIFGLIILIPTVLMPLSVLSYASILGLISTLLIISVILIDGFSKPDSPGSLWSPADTSFGVSNAGKLGVSFGLFMAGFSGHAVIPSLARDMIDPSQFDTMINWAFSIATAIYAVIGVAGYVMFGNSVSDEFSQDLIAHSIYPTLNKMALWGLVLTPLSKYALATRPLSLTLEMILGIESGPRASVDDHGAKPAPEATDGSATSKNIALKRTFTVLERTMFTLLSVGTSIMVPEFSSMMAFLGAFSSFLLCVIGPVSAKISLAGKCSIWDALLLIIAVIMAVWGTGAAFWSI